MLWTWITFVAVMALGPFASEALFLDMTYDCEVPTDDPLHRCWPPLLSANPFILRLLQALLTFIAIMTLSLCYIVSRCYTGIYDNPTKLSTVMSLFSHPAVLADFQKTDPNGTLSELRSHIGHKNYRLDYYNTVDGSSRYGVVPSSPDEVEDRRSLSSTHKPRAESNLMRKWDLGLDVFFSFFLIGVLIVVVSYFRDDSDSAFNRFFNSNSFGPRFFMTIVGSVISSNWNRLERCK